MEYLKLYLAVLNSFTLSKYFFLIKAHPNEIKISGNESNKLTNKTIKLFVNNHNTNILFIESCLRFLKTLSIKNLLSVEDCYYCGIITKLDQFLFNDICYEYISSKTKLFIYFSVILDKISESSYYKQIFLDNTNLIEKYISKFYENENKQVNKFFLLKIIY